MTSHKDDPQRLKLAENHAYMLNSQISYMFKSAKYLLLFIILMME